MNIIKMNIFSLDFCCVKRKLDFLIADYSHCKFYEYCFKITFLKIKIG